MGKPLLTDDIIERANRGERFDSSYDGPCDDQDTRDMIAEEVPPLPPKSGLWSSKKTNPIIKSRRIENAKRNAFQAKINRILILVLVLFALLLAAIFYL